MKVDLTKPVKMINGRTIPFTEEKDFKTGKELSGDTAKLLEVLISKVTDETVQKELSQFFIDYRIMTEIVKRDMVMRDAFHLIITNVKNPTGLDLVRRNKLAPRLDVDCNEIELEQKEVQWLLAKMMKAEDGEINSTVKAEVQSQLDPDGEIILDGKGSE
jgi:hypothetical protein